MRLITTLLFLILCGPQLAQAQEQPVAAESDAAVVERLRAHLDDLRSFEAQFTQEIFGAQADGEVSRGRFYLERPGKLRWDYVSPNVQVIVADGANLWVYDRDLNQVTVKPIDEVLAATPAMLLAGKVSVIDAFTVTEGRKRDNLDWIRLAPRRKDTDFLSIELGFAGAELRTMELRDKLGQTTRISFTRIRRNGRMDPKMFQFRVPKGADLIGTPAPAT